MRFIGRREGISDELTGRMDWAEAETDANDRITLFVAFNYGGRSEILDAATAYDGGGEEEFRSHLYAPEMHDPDLLIRTSGEQRLSNLVKKYNPYMGTKFSTYAAFWIRAYILKYIMDSWSLVKVGTTQGQRRLFFRLNKEKQKLESQGIYPTAKLLASTISVKEEEINSMTERLTYTDVSLDAAIHDGSDDTMMDTIRSDDDVEEIVSERQKSYLLSKKVTEFKCTLDDRDSFIFNHRVMAEDPMTLEEIGSRFNISRERVRQVELRMIKKLKDHFQGEASVFGLQPQYETPRQYAR